MREVHLPQGVRKAKVLFIDLGATFGGAEIYLLRLLSSLREEVDCEVLCSQKELQKRLDELGLTYTSVFSATGALKVAQLAWAACVICRKLVLHRIDVLQINGYSEIIFLPIARLLGRRAVPTRHLSFEIEADHWYQAPGRFLARWLYRALARTATSVVCVSQEVGREVEALAPGRVTVIQNWVDSVPPLPTRTDRLTGGAAVLFVGRLVRHKGLQLVLEAMRLLQMKEFPTSLTIVGDGPHRAELEQLAEGLNVRFAGFQRDVTHFYEDVDLLVTPSLGPEGSSLVTLEAMANGLPCLLSDLPVHREIARGGEVAGLFRSGDATDLAAQIERMLGDRSLCDGYARAAYRVVSAEHDGTRARKAYCKVLIGG